MAEDFSAHQHRCDSFKQYHPTYPPYKQLCLKYGLQVQAYSLNETIKKDFC
jgi:hypothetical protein